MNECQEKGEQGKFIRLVKEIISHFDTNLILSPHVIPMDKGRCNEEKDMVEPFSSPDNTGTICQQNREIRAYCRQTRYLKWCRRIHRA